MSGEISGAPAMKFDLVAMFRELAGTEIYTVLFNYAKQSLIIGSIGSVLGSLLALKMVDYVSRKMMLFWASLALALLFLITGSLMQGTSTTYHPAIASLYGLCHLFFNLGPKVFLFMMAAEIFPTRYRATGYGIAFASGTVGSIFAQIIPDTLTSNSLKTRAAFVLGSSGYLIGAAVFAWVWLPDVQLRRRSELARGRYIYHRENRTLESLAKGRKIAEEDIPLSRFENWFWEFRRSIWSWFR